MWSPLETPAKAQVRSGGRHATKEGTVCPGQKARPTTHHQTCNTPLLFTQQVQA